MILNIFYASLKFQPNTLGVESDHEEAVVCTDAPVDKDEFIVSINKQLPFGVKVTAAVNKLGD